ncbi:CGNR zinc finger domain-containing protein [Paenarthrobacter sp. NPDC092416]|uniref:CGNR zinc finger domain-containing protein n=1 Tax=Paenarthrobacter sp. NPDC092416 TaxID=3364386 RepID=UPI0037F76D7B
MGFVFVSGNAALDFVGTLKWRRSDLEELLNLPGDVGVWADEAGIITTPLAVSDDEFVELLGLREAIYRMVTSEMAGLPLQDADVQALNKKLEGRIPRLRFEAGGLIRTGDASSLATSIATAAAELLSGDERSKLKECGRENCTRIFIDRSRSGTRTWCGMEECGNRIKAANYRSRRKARTEQLTTAS